MHINLLRQGDQFYVYESKIRVDYVVTKVDAENRQVIADTIKTRGKQNYVELRIFPFYEEVFAKNMELWERRRI